MDWSTKANQFAAIGLTRVEISGGGPPSQERTRTVEASARAYFWYFTTSPVGTSTICNLAFFSGLIS